MSATEMPVTEISAAEPSPIPQASVAALRVLPVLLAPPRSTYSIRLADEPDSACLRCDKPIGAGPIGDLAGSPLCDDCLMSDCYELGMVLAMVAFIRGFGSADPDDREIRDHALAALARFADVFEQVAAAWGPPRYIVDPEAPAE